MNFCGKCKFYVEQDRRPEPYEACVVREHLITYRSISRISGENVSTRKSRPLSLNLVRAEEPNCDNYQPNLWTKIKKLFGITDTLPDTDENLKLAGYQ